MDNLDKMDKFLETYNFPRLNQEEAENLNRPITSSEIKAVIKKRKKKQKKTNTKILWQTSSGLDRFTGKF